MKLAVLMMSVWIGTSATADCLEEEFTVPPYCFTPAQARYTCENSGMTDVGLNQVVQCLDSWITQNGVLAPLDRANCIGEDVVSEVSAENVSRCPAN